MTYLAYLIFAVVAALFLSRKTDRKLLSFVLILWLLAQPVINAKFIIALPGLPFELQPNRILFLVMFVYLVWDMLTRPKSAPEARPPFEKYIYAYLVLVIVALAVNFSYMNPKSVIAVPLEIVTFLTVYTVTKRCMTESVFEAIIKGIILLSVVSAVIAVLQFTVAPMLLRTGDLRPAFGNTLRATGIFQSEYDFGYLQILAIIIALIRYRGRMVRFFVIPLLVLSILLTFHRLDYIILYLCVVAYLAILSKRKLSLSAIALAIAIPALLLLSYEAYKTWGGHSVVVEERLKADTITGRFHQYQVVWDSMWDHPLGLGSYDHPDYVRLMSQYGMLQWFIDKLGRSYTMPLAVHNGYLAAGIQYGVLGMVAFIFLVFSMLLYLKRRVDLQWQYSAVPFFAAMIYALSNISNSISIFRAYFVLLLAILCGSLVRLYRKHRKRNEFLKNVVPPNTLAHVPPERTTSTGTRVLARKS